MSDIKLPKRGDTVFVDDGGKWLGGIVNSIAVNGMLLVGVKGHSKGAEIVGVRPNEYLKYWCYPGDLDKKSLESERSGTVEKSE